MLDPSKKKTKSNITHMFWFKVDGESFQTPTVIIMSEAKPID